MSTPPSVGPESSGMISMPASGASARPDKVAPWWHTILFIVLMAIYGLIELRYPPSSAAHGGPHARLVLYGLTIAFEYVLLGYVWLLGLKLQGKKLREIIGGNWSKFDQVAIDIGFAFLFWMAAVMVLLITQKLVGVHASSLENLKFIFPHNIQEGVLWVVLACSAGFCEETVFRGYLQRQFLAATGNRWFAVILQAVVFGWVHVYQSAKNAIVIAVYGALFGILAVIRGNLRPGMIQHSCQDTLAGIAGAILSKHKFI